MDQLITGVTLGREKSPIDPIFLWHLSGMVLRKLVGENGGRGCIIHRLIPAVDGCNPQKIRVLGLLKMLGQKKMLFFQMVAM